MLELKYMNKYINKIFLYPPLTISLCLNFKQEKND